MDIDRVWSTGMRVSLRDKAHLRGISPCRGPSSPLPRRHGSGPRGENRGDLLRQFHRGEKLVPKGLRWIPWAEVGSASPADALQMATLSEEFTGDRVGEACRGLC
jgi:hypothetical protein